MSASSSDSWILIVLTILVVLLLFYLSKKMICNSYGSSISDDDGPTTSPSSSATSTSTSFSDYLYGDGSGPFSPIDAGDASFPSSANSSGTTDDVAIDIADYPGSDPHHRYQIHHYLVDNGCYDNNNGSDILARNNLHLSSSVRGGNGMRCERRDSAIDSNNREMRMSSGLPPTSSTTRSSQQPNHSPISIIARPDLDRKTMLEDQLRNQIAKIVQAEREIQRLVQQLSQEQRQGLDGENNDMLAATRASLLQHYRRYPHIFRRRLRTNIPLEAASSSASVSLTDTVTTSTPLQYKNNIVTNISAPYFPTDQPIPGTASPALADNNGNDELCQAHSSEASSPATLHRHHHHENENVSGFSDFPDSSCYAQNLPTRQHQQQQQLLCGPDTSFLVGFQRHHNSGCNLCYPTTIGSRTSRMMMLRRILLPLSSFPIYISHANDVTRARRDSVERAVLDPVACHLHYHNHPQFGFFDYTREPNDDEPPPYEECILSNNNNSDDDGDSASIINNNNIIP